MSEIRKMLLVLALATICLPAQDPPAQQPSPEQQQAQQPVPTRPLDDTTAKALERLATVLAERRQAAAAARTAKDLEAAKTLDEEVRTLSLQFAALAARLDVQQFESPATATQFDVRQELEELVRPLVRYMRDATEGPRESADLKGRIELFEERITTAETAQRAVERTRDALPAGSAARAEAERELEQRWKPSLESLRDELLVARASLLRHEESAKPAGEKLTEAFRSFVQDNGLTVLLAALVCVAVLLVGNSLVARLIERSRRRKAFSMRLIAVIARTGVVLLAVVGTILVPYLRDNFVLLALGILFLLGAGWVLLSALPKLAEQVRLLLNIGGVREGERILVDGLPFRVVALRFYTRLENPDLQGGLLRVPLGSLVGERSRESGPDEPWFPTRPGDIVILADGTFGKVITQTPETVVLEHWSGARSYPTSQFLAQTPRNLSRGFAVDTRFLVGREHFAEATTTIRARIEAAIGERVRAVAPPGSVRSVRVMFRGVHPTGLEYFALAVCDGSAAPLYADLRREMHAAFVDACRDNGWELPAPTVVPPPGD